MGLEVKFQNHPNFVDTVKYLSGYDWLLEFNNIEYGIFKVKFTREGNDVKTFELKVNDFVEYDVYEFVKG